jgi:hypothetical protein
LAIDDDDFAGVSGRCCDDGRNSVDNGEEEEKEMEMLVSVEQRWISPL